MKIIRDSREQKGWNFEDCSSCSEVIDQKLETGDYCIFGMEEILCIERKASVAELAACISKTRFKNELLRMEKIPHRYLILEFSLQDVVDFPNNSSIPKHRWNQLRISSKFIIKRLSEIAVIHNIHVVFCDNKQAAKNFSVSIMKEINEKHSR